MTWDLALGAGTSGTTWTVNGKPYDDMRSDATVELGTVQRWAIVNSSQVTHFVHLHEEAWRTISRNGRPPPAWEAGLQDTWRLDPGDVVEVAAKITDFTGPFLLHCHMLDHEDHGMMATFFVVNTVVRPGAKLASLTSRYLCRVRKENP
jgi:FtsP/CotA-like multicopper oxidase with cupredoxin domain